MHPTGMQSCFVIKFHLLEIASVAVLMNFCKIFSFQNYEIYEAKNTSFQILSVHFLFC